MEKDIEVEELEKIEENDEPIIGMSFDSDTDLFIYFKEYGKRKGFLVLRRTSRKDSNGILRNVTFACRRNGETRSKSVNILKPQPNAKQVAMQDWELGIKLCKNYQSLVIEAGGHENVSFIERDCRNHVQKERRLRLGDGDDTALQNYFMKVQAKDNRFYFSMQVDDEGRLKNVFWAETRNRKAYKEFGDVVTFDTTYLTNKYDMLFAPFVGINHHGHSILFRCRLISHEDIETFTWLFRTWLFCMSNSAPIRIITDQDRAIKVAIQNVFPNTRHRWCLWHIMKKIPEKLGGYKEYRDISNVLHCAVYDSQSAAQFEETWHHMIVEYDLGDNEWLRGLYDETHHWVPCYLNNTFWAGMSSTQRSESMNVFFDGYVNSKTTLKQFVEQYSCALKNKVQKEVEKDVRHAVTIMIRNDVEVLPKKYILRRWRKDVWRCHSRVKTSYELHSCTDEQKRYEKMCATFAEEDLSKAVPCGGNEVTVVTGQGSCSVEVETVRDPVARRRNGQPPCQRKKSNKFLKSKMNSSRSNAKINDAQMYVLLTLQDNDQVPTVIPTHKNNVVTLGIMFIQHLHKILIRNHNSSHMAIFTNYSFSKIVNMKLIRSFEVIS
ncbi:protein FAR1-RELATED SEQUENCE [Citrus sinensis]|uniref:Protein FAR1-RELATED SEQUENCE n=1 Tax=Citrus sinensis TaxID=2711 RepID=A0ACB8ILT6_CITSI|nr:protein FAR1-RELATED SEQUENCE [Citrus sinensis]